MGAHSRVSRSRSSLRRIAGGASLGVVAVGSVVGGTGVAQAEQTVSSHGVSVTVPDSCDVYLQAGLADAFPDSAHSQRCLAEKGLSTPAATDVSTVSPTPTPGGTSSTTSSSDGSSTTTTTTETPSAPSTSSSTPAPSSTPSSTSSTASTPVRTESGATSDDPADQPAAPGETKSVPIG